MYVNEIPLGRSWKLFKALIAGILSLEFLASDETLLFCISLFNKRDKFTWYKLLFSFPPYFLDRYKILESWDIFLNIYPQRVLCNYQKLRFWAWPCDFGLISTHRLKESNISALQTKNKTDLVAVTTVFLFGSWS